MAHRCKGQVSSFYRNLFIDEQVRDFGNDALEVLRGLKAKVNSQGPHMNSLNLSYH